MRARRVVIALLALSPLLSACARDGGQGSGMPGDVAVAQQERPAHAASTAADASPVLPSLPGMVVHKSPACGCCSLWVEHLSKAGFEVEVRDHEPEALNRVKLELGVPYGKGSCHTAEVGGYYVEGHVPPDDIKRLLAEAPDAKGLVLPGMPMGSPGMEMPDGRSQPYTVELVRADGAVEPFASH